MSNLTDKSLLEQMQMHDLEIAKRKELLGFTKTDEQLLAEAQSFIAKEMDNIVDEFYRQETSIEEVALIIGDSETLRRLRNSQIKYVSELFSGHYDESYVNNRLRIGLVHKRIGVEPKYYLSAVKILQEILHQTIIANIADETNTTNTLSALDKVIFFDITLVFDTYIRSLVGEIEIARDKAMKYASLLEQKVAERTHELELLSRVDSLTGLLNRRAFIEELRRELLRAQRNSAMIALVYIDINDFKQINDTEGHHKGDEVLKLLGNIITHTKRDIDIAARLGGDEFCIVLPRSSLENANTFVQRLSYRLRELDKNISLSSGISQAGPEQYDTADELLQKADKEMFEVKKKFHTGPLANTS